MHIIEPCCAQRHLRMLRDSIARGGTKQFEGYGDLSLTELLPALLTRYSETEMLIAAPAIPDQAFEIINRYMRRQWARADGKGKLDVISHLTIIADLSQESSPEASVWMKDNPFGERLTLVDTEQSDTVILMPDFAITGPVNMRYGHNFTATATTVAAEVDKLWEGYRKYTAEKRGGEKTGSEESPKRKRTKGKRAKAQAIS